MFCSRATESQYTDVSRMQFCPLYSAWQEHASGATNVHPFTHIGTKADRMLPRHFSLADVIVWRFTCSMNTSTVAGWWGTSPNVQPICNGIDNNHDTSTSQNNTHSWRSDCCSLSLAIRNGIGNNCTISKSHENIPGCKLENCSIFFSTVVVKTTSIICCAVAMLTDSLHGHLGLMNGPRRRLHPLAAACIVWPS